MKNESCCFGPPPYLDNSESPHLSPFLPFQEKHAHSTLGPGPSLSPRQDLSSFPHVQSSCLCWSLPVVFKPVTESFDTLATSSSSSSSSSFLEELAMEIFLFFVELGWLDIVYANRTGEGSPVETVRKGYLSEDAASFLILHTDSHSHLLPTPRPSRVLL